MISTRFGSQIEAHGIGGQADLPIPLSMAVAGAVAALVLSFTVLIVAWRTPRYATPSGRPAPSLVQAVAASPYTAIVLRCLGMVLFLFTAATAIFGKNSLTNPFFGIVYVWLWVGLIAASLLCGPVWRAISPARTINRLLAMLAGSDAERGLKDYPERLGHWPAALGLFAFVWLELVYRFPTELGAVRLWFAIYVATMLIGGAVYGNRFYARADPFEVYSTLIGKLSPWAKQDGRVVLRNPLANLATVVPRPGLVAVVGVLFGSTAFDSFRESAFWIRTTYEAGLSKSTLDNAALIVFCLTAIGLFSLACMSVGVSVTWIRWERWSRISLPRFELTELGTTHRRMPMTFGHSIVPIIGAYIFAHYLTLLLDVGTQTLARASDPFGEGWDILGTAALTPSYWFSYHPTLLASLKVIAVVAGHVAGAVAAHDRALQVLPRKHQVNGQLPLLAVMVAFTAGGLYLLFGA